MDKCVGEVVDTGLEKGYVVLVTGDHARAHDSFSLILFKNLGDVIA